MLFNSVTFLVFFILVLILYNMPFSWRAKKSILLVSSYLFYAAWNPPFVILVWISTIVDWYAAGAMPKATTKRGRFALLLISLISNLGLLGFFKYGNFLLDNFRIIIGIFGIEYTPPEYNIILPVGISFYTFQTLSYTFDVYKNKTQPWTSFLDFALFVTFFPQLIAGPIVRAVEFLPQCETQRKVTGAQLSWGGSLLILGLFEKVVIADGLMGPISDKVFSSFEQLGWHNAWAGTLAFSVQIFCDFAGYSTCAIGIALCLGFALPDNFHFPYASSGFSDFWRRWHISLSTWLRDYLYISLGGNRNGEMRTYINLMITMLLGGLWHGASWTFVVWGGVHGAFLAIERYANSHMILLDDRLRLICYYSFIPVTYICICFTWVLFRAQTFGQAFLLSSSMLGFDGSSPSYVLDRVDMIIVAFVNLVVLFLHFSLRNSSIEYIASRTSVWIRGAVLALMLIGIVFNSGGDTRAFIYFQF